METPVVRLLIRSGLVPENVLQQLSKWKLLDPRAVILDGTSELGWAQAADFARALESLIHQENVTIRESEVVSGTFKRAWLFYRYETVQRHVRKDVVVDKMQRIFVPVGAVEGEEIVAVSFADSLEDAVSSPLAVVNIETRYSGEEKAAYVLYTEDDAVWCDSGDIEVAEEAGP